MIRYAANRVVHAPSETSGYFEWRLVRYRRYILHKKMFKDSTFVRDSFVIAQRRFFGGANTENTISVVQ